MFVFFLTTVCVKLLGLYLPLYMFCCMRASVSGLMALLSCGLSIKYIHLFIHLFMPHSNESMLTQKETVKYTNKKDNRYKTTKLQKKLQKILVVDKKI